MRVFWDVDTQNDFMNPDGALYIPKAELIKPNLGRLTDYAERNGIPILGSVDRHFGSEGYKDREGELARNGGPFPDHCMDDTEGQKKIAETTLIRNLGMAETGPVLDFIADDPLEGLLFRGLWFPKYFKIDEKRLRLGGLAERLPHNQLFFEKQSYDVFTNPAVEKFIDMAGIDEAVVYGVATDYCVRAAALGLQARDVQTYVVTDAIEAVNIDFEGNPDSEFGRKALEKMVGAGARLVTTQDVLGGRK